jgi:DnaJ-class molecular chaperone
MPEQVHDKRQAELPWPGKRARCPKCRGAGDVHRTLQHVSAPTYEVIGGKRVPCSACGGTGKVRVPVQAGNG